MFAGVYSDDPDDYEDLEKALKKLALTDSSVTLQYESSAALGSGFRCGFLGMLHLEIIQERLSREFDQEVITTVPNVSYVAYTKRNGSMVINRDLAWCKLEFCLMGILLWLFYDY